MLVVVLEFEKMPVAIMGPHVLHFWGHIFGGLKQGLSLLHGKAGLEIKQPIWHESRAQCHY